MVGTCSLTICLPRLVIGAFTAAWFELIEANHESFRPVHFQSIDAAVIPRHIELQPKPDDLLSLRIIDACKFRLSPRGFKLPLHLVDIRHGKIELYPPRG